MTSPHIAKMKKPYKKAKHYLEYIAFIALTSLLRLMSIDKSADLCSFIARKIYQYLPVTQIAQNNLRRFLGVQSGKIEEDIINGLWDNFGRFIGEFPHIHSLTMEEIKSRVEIIGLENIRELQDKQRPFLIFSGHFANWDFILRIMELLYPKLGIVYRKANNPMVDRLINKWRGASNINLIPKGPMGARSLIKSIKSGDSIGMLVDQKMNDGIEVPFFGAPAMTAPAIGKFALQFGYPIIPLQIIRTKGTRFKVIVHPALDIKVTKDEERDIYSIMVEINEILEGWIRQNPDQWFWFHNRWRL